eukprot:1591783-Heterocapsa_arctica.AAC.1
MFHDVAGHVAQQGRGSVPPLNVLCAAQQPEDRLQERPQAGLRVFHRVAEVHDPSGRSRVPDALGGLLPHRRPCGTIAGQDALRRVPGGRRRASRAGAERVRQEALPEMRQPEEHVAVQCAAALAVLLCRPAVLVFESAKVHHRTLPGRLAAEDVRGPASR